MLYLPLQISQTQILQHARWNMQRVRDELIKHLQVWVEDEKRKIKTAICAWKLGLCEA